MAKLRILVLQWRDVENPASGGAERVLYFILKELVTLGYDVIKIAPRFSGCKRIEVLNGIKIVRIGQKYSVYILAVIYYLIHLKRNVDFVIDVVTGVPWFTPLYVKKPKLAIIYHLGRKETFFSEFPTTEGLIGYFLAAVGWLAERTLPILYKAVPFVTLSQDTKGDLVNMGLDEKWITVVQEGIDLSLLKPGELKSPFPHMIYIGRLTRSKGVNFLIQSMKLVVVAVPEAKLSIVGRGHLENELKKTAQRLGIEKSIVFHGYLPEDEKIELLRKAHVLVMPSFREGWATPVIEANACGTPAVGTDAIGVRSTIRENVTGFLVPYGNTKMLADRVVRLLTDDELRNKMRLVAIAWAKKFDRKKMVPRFAALLENYGAPKR